MPFSAFATETAIQPEPVHISRILSPSIVLEIKRSELKNERTVKPSESKKIAEIAAKRLAGRPLPCNPALYTGHKLVKTPADKRNYYDIDN